MVTVRQPMARNRARVAGRDFAGHHLLMIFTVIVVLAPILPILYQSFLDAPLYRDEATLTTQNYSDLFTSPTLRTVIVDSLLFGLGATVVAVFIGTAAAIVIGRIKIPFARLLDELQLWPLYLSPLILAFGWVITYGPAGYVSLFIDQKLGMTFPGIYNLPGLMIIAGISQAPFIYLFTRSSVMASNANLEDAARSVGAPPGRVIRSIIGPMLRPPILYGVLLTFATSIEMLSIPLIIGRPVGIRLIASYLYEEGVLSPRPDYGLLASMSVLLLIFVALLIAIQSKLLGNVARFVTVEGKATPARKFDVGAARWVYFGLLVLYVIFGVLIPTIGIAVRACVGILTPLVPIADVLTWGNFEHIFTVGVYQRSITNSLLLSVVGGAVAALVVTGIVLVSQRSEYRFRGSLDQLSIWPRAVPGVVMGLGFFWLILLLGLSGVRSSLWLLALVFFVRFLPHGYAATAPMMMRFSRDLDRSARAAGAGWWTMVRHILFPLAKPAIFSSYVLLFLLFLKEYASAVFLYSSGNEIIGVTMLSAWTQGNVGPVAALVVFQLLVSVVIIYAARRLLGVRINA